MSKAKKLSLSVIFQFISIMVTGIVGVLIVPIIIKLLGQEYYGVLEIILSLMFINFFFELGMGSTLLRYIPVYEKKGKQELSTFLWTYLYFKSTLALIASFIVLFVGFKFDVFFNIGHTDVALVKSSVYIFAIGIFITNIATFLSNTLKGFQRFDFAIIPDMIGQLMFLILTYILSLKGAKNVSVLDIALLMFIIRPMIRIIMGSFFLKKTTRKIIFRPIKPKVKYIKESFGFLKGMSLITIFAQLYNRGPKMIMGVLLNPVSIAYWGIAERLRGPIEQVNSSLIRPLIPMAASMSLDNRSKTNDLIIKITKVQFLLIGGISSFVILYINKFIEIWLSEEYLQVGSIIKIWLIPFILPSAGVLLMFYYARGKTRLSQNMNILNTFLGLLLGTFLMIKLDSVGFALGLIISTFITTIIYFYYLCNEFHISFWEILKGAYIYSYFVIGITIFLNYCIMNFIQIDSWSTLILASSIGLILYLIAILLSLNKEEKKLYKGLIRSFGVRI